MTIDEAIKHCEEEAEKYMAYGIETECYQCGKEHEQLAEWLKELKEAKRLLQAAEKTIDDYCRGYCECCKNRDFALARCGIVNGCRDKDNWEWILSYRVKELFKED